MKIVYCLDGICGRGGIGMVTCAKANALAHGGNEVYIIVTDHDCEKCPPLNGVHLVDLDVNLWDNDSAGLLYYISLKARKKRQLHRQRLENKLNEIQPDIVISVGWSEKYIIPIISENKPWVTIREWHYNRNYRFDAAKYEGGNKFNAYLRALLAELYEWFRGGDLYDHTVVLTQQDKIENWKNNQQISVIPNPSTFQTNIYTNYGNRVVLTASRLHQSKQIDHIIRAWSRIKTEASDWKLYIYGEGPDRLRLESLIMDLQLSDHVILKGCSYDMANDLSAGDFFVFTSAFEGFGIVLVEAMTCGLPCISYACPCGPADIISHFKDGVLVPLNDEKQLSQEILNLINSPETLHLWGKEAKLKSAQYTPSHIVKSFWIPLFQRLIAEKCSKFY